MSNFQTIEIDFETIYPIWDKELWPNRNSKIEPVSSMKWLGGYDLEIKKNKPTFWAIYDNNNIIAVNSGYATSETQYRSRGLWVSTKYRGLGLTKILFSNLELKAKELNKSFLWSVPRKEAINAYISYGFVTIGEYFNTLEYGPNIYVCKNI